MCALALNVDAVVLKGYSKAVIFEFEITIQSFDKVCESVEVDRHGVLLFHATLSILT